jgi:hypothetical protein
MKSHDPRRQEHITEQDLKDLLWKPVNVTNLEMPKRGAISHIKPCSYPVKLILLTI